MSRLIPFSFLILFLNVGYNQSDDFPLLDESEIVHLRCRAALNTCLVKIIHLPEALFYSVMCISNTSNNFYHCIHLDPYQHLTQEIQFVLSDTYLGDDLMTLYFQNVYNGYDLQYSCTFRFTSREGLEIKLGEDAYKLSCIPQNDPWMPHAEQPYLFYKDEFYLNPKSGFIMKGKRAVNSGLYTPCILEDWKRIEPNVFYTNKNGEKFSGSELISKRRIKLKEWDLEVF